MLGLPEITLEERMWFRSWSEEAYDYVRKYQELKGFDPDTTDFARSMEAPILELVTDEDRFEVVNVSKSPPEQSSASGTDSSKEDSE